MLQLDEFFLLSLSCSLKWSESLSSNFICSLVDCRFFRSWSRWTFAVAIDFGGCFLNDIYSIPGHESKLPSFIDQMKVLRTGYPTAS